MEPAQQEQASSNRSWVLRNTFIEFVEDDADEFSSCLMRASSDSVLYEGYSRTRMTEVQEPEPQEPQIPAPRVPREGKSEEVSAVASDEAMDSEADFCSDTETSPDTNEGEKSLPLLCYSHINDSGASSPISAHGRSDFDRHVAWTPSPRGTVWPSTFAEAASLLPKDEEIRSDPVPDLVPPMPPSHATSSAVQCGGSSAPSRRDLQRLAAEIARLERENDLLRRMAQGPNQEPRSHGDVSQAANAANQVGSMAWATALMPMGFAASSSSSQMPHVAQVAQVPPIPQMPQGSADTWSSSYEPHSQDQVDAISMVRRDRSRKQESDADPDAEFNSQSRPDRGTPSPMKAVECDVPMEECTTVMLRNLPNNYTREMLLAMLDNEGFQAQYDFLYLPMDFQRRACMGYAFINLVDPAHVPRFWSTFSGFTRWAIPSKKVCRVSLSGPHQGLQAHVERYRNSPVMHETVPDEYKPMVLQDGVRVAFPKPSKSSRPPRNRQSHRGNRHQSPHGRGGAPHGKAAASRRRRPATNAPRQLPSTPGRVGS